ncbi:MAG: type II toxin-antitoxin system VapC family toxin [Candidatus Bathyarchaeia archaeon]
MLIESDLFIAYMKKEDWLKESAEKIFRGIEEGKIPGVQVSSEIFHEIYYVFTDYVPLDTLLKNQAKMATMENITYIDATREIYLSALELMSTYKVNSIFDAIYAATTLTEKVPDNTIVSTDNVYEKIKGIRRIDPREIDF